MSCCALARACALAVAPLAAVSLLAACYLPPPVYVLHEPPPPMTVTAPPPAPRTEVQPLPPGDPDQYVWQPGYWHPDQDDGAYRWVEGCWVPAQPERELVVAAYYVDAGQWHYRPPYWRRHRRAHGRRPGHDGRGHHRRDHARTRREHGDRRRPAPEVSDRRKPAPEVRREARSTADEPGVEATRHREAPAAPQHRVIRLAEPDLYRDRTGAILLSPGPARRRLQRATVRGNDGDSVDRAADESRMQPRPASRSRDAGDTAAAAGAAVVPSSASPDRSLTAGQDRRVSRAADELRQLRRRELLLRDPSWRPPAPAHSTAPRANASSGDSSSARTSSAWRTSSSSAPSSASSGSSSGSSSYRPPSPVSTARTDDRNVSSYRVERAASIPRVHHGSPSSVAASRVARSSRASPTASTGVSRSSGVGASARPGSRQGPPGVGRGGSRRARSGR